MKNIRKIRRKTDFENSRFLSKKIVGPLGGPWDTLGGPRIFSKIYGNRKKSMFLVFFCMFAFEIDFGSILDRFWGRFWSDFGVQTRSQKQLKIWLIFGLKFLTILASFGGPSWGHVGTFSAKTEGLCGGLARLLLVLCFWTDLDRPEPILVRFWADVGRIWDDFCLNFWCELCVQILGLFFCLTLGLIFCLICFVWC